MYNLSINSGVSTELRVAANSVLGKNVNFVCAKCLLFNQAEDIELL